MTCRERFWKEYPDLTLKGKCPQDYGYSPQRPWDCYEIACWECWEREPIKNPDDKKGENVMETPTDDLISRERALEALRAANVRVTGMRIGKTILAKYAEQVREGYIDILREVPAETGHWINVGKTEKGSPIRKCSYCGIEKAGRPKSKFCPDCGCKMLLTMDELTDVLKGD